MRREWTTIHKILLDALGFDPADLDVLVVRTGFKPEAVSSMMLIPRGLEGHVAQAAPGAVTPGESLGAGVER